MTTFRSFAFTLRPRNGFNDDEKLLKFMEKFTYGKAVAEKENMERHIHGQVFLDTASTTGNFRNKLQRCFPPDGVDWNRRVSYNVKIAYNDEYIEEYMEKDDPEVLFEKVPSDTAGYYPTLLEQEFVQKRANAKDHQLNFLEDLWKKENENLPASIAEVCDFLSDQMFCARTIRTVPIRNCYCLARRLYMYLIKQRCGAWILAD